MDEVQVTGWLITCTQCNGRGRVTRWDRWLGNIEVPCPKCRGKGKILLIDNKDGYVIKEG